MSCVKWQYIFSVKNLVWKIETMRNFNILEWYYGIIMKYFSEVIMALWLCFRKKRITLTFLRMWCYDWHRLYYNVEGGNAGVSVHLGRSNKSPQTRWLMKSRNVLLLVLEPESLRSGGQHGLVRSLFPAADLSLCPHVAARVGELCEASRSRRWSHSRGLLFHDWQTSQRLHLLTPSPLRG